MIKMHFNIILCFWTLVFLLWTHFRGAAPTPPPPPPPPLNVQRYVYSVHKTTMFFSVNRESHVEIPR